MLRLIPALTSAVATDVSKTIRRKRRNLIIYCVAGLFALTAYFAGVMAAVTYLMQSESALASWLIVALAAFTLFIVLIAGLMVLNHFEKRKTKSSMTRSEMLATTTAVAAAFRGLNKKSSVPLVIAALAGLYVYNQQKSDAEHG